MWSECLAVWVALASYCQRTLSDGHVPDSRLARLTPLGARAKTRCDDMVRAGLMERVEDGYVFHDWLVYQASRRQVEEQREQKTQRQARWRKGSGNGGGSTGAPPTAAVDAHVDASTSRLVDAPRDAPVEPAPSHPIPSHPIPRSTSVSYARAPEAGSSTPALDEARRAEAVRARLGPLWRERTGSTPPELSALTPKAEVVAQLAGLPDDPELGAVLERFFDDPKMREKGWPIGWLLRNPAQWSGRATAKGGHAAPRKAHEYERRSLSFDQLMTEAEAGLNGGSHG